jgi:integrase
MTVEKRGRFYHYEFMEGRKRYFGSFNGKNGKPIAKDKREAKELEFKERLKVRNGTNLEDEEREELKDFTTFVDKIYLPFAREHHASPRHAEFRCQILKEFFVGKRFSDITAMVVISFINTRLNSETVRKEVLEDGAKVSRKRSPTTVNKEVSLLSSIFIMAVREKAATSNPCDELPKSVRDKIPARRKRNRRLSLDEERSLFDVGLGDRREHLRPITEVALCTGMRKGELFRLQPEHINFGLSLRSFVINGETWHLRPNWLIITKSKNGRPRMIPMSRRVRQRLETRCNDATCGEYVFSSIRTGKQITDIKRGFRSACAEAKLVNFTFHDLRHEWSSRAAECGVPEHVRRDILGHSSTSITGDYTHASPEAMEEAMELVAAYGRKSRNELRQISGKRTKTAGVG